MSSAFLDLRTLSLVLMTVTAVFGIAMLFIWRTNKTYRGYNFWAVSNLMIAVGFLFLSLRGIIPDLFTIIVGNSLTFGGVLLIFEGNLKFLRLKSQKWFSLALFVFHITTLVCFTYLSNNVILRIIFTSILLTIISVWNAFVFYYGEQKENTLIYKFAAGTYIIFGILMMLRAILSYLYSDITDFYAPDWIQSATFLTFIIFVIIWTYNYLILNNERLNKELSQIQVELQQQATTDFLTGVKNSRRFFEIGNNEIQRANRFHNTLSLVMFDIDHFKQVNDSYGHAAGDKVLKTVADLCKNTLRNIDTIARLGGEEFGVLLPHTDIEDAEIVADYLRKVIENSEIEYLRNKIRITASFGVAELVDNDTEIKTLLDRTDKALYQAKNNGRNRVVSDIEAKNGKKNLAIA